MFKIGDRIYCHITLRKPIITDNDWHISIIPGIYIIKSISNYCMHDYYYLNEISGSFHCSYFISIKDSRKIKLNIICSKKETK